MAELEAIDAGKKKHETGMSDAVLHGVSPVAIDCNPGARSLIATLNSEALRVYM
ncbi:hypothetical protein [Paraburkholderia piptadeniae]|uniref:hypothetical protein n=1 Tax=Paraburkholderia piptadeniae TaxID=1701573 RepID=UPI00135BE96F|nr:hypothetical protein [Paraburkholderia piptadeniae]